DLREHDVGRLQDREEDDHPQREGAHGDDLADGVLGQHDPGGEDADEQHRGRLDHAHGRVLVSSRQSPERCTRAARPVAWARSGLSPASTPKTRRALIPRALNDSATTTAPATAAPPTTATGAR